MSGKDYLKRIVFLNKLINKKIQKQYEMRLSLTGSSPILDENKVQTTPEQDRMGLDISNIVDLEEEINQNIDELVKMRNKVRRYILTMDNPRYADIIRMRYCQGIRLKVIAEEMGISLENAKVTHWRALQEFDKIFK